MSNVRLLLLSASVVGGGEFLEYAEQDIKEFLHKYRVSTVLFIPYARLDHDAYLEIAMAIFNKWGYPMEGIDKCNPVKAIKRAHSIYIGGGNTFLLLKTLNAKNLMKPIREMVMENGIPYIGSGAGASVAGTSIANACDMAIVYPPNFNGLGLTPFNVRTHDTNNPLNQDWIAMYHDLPKKYQPVYDVLALRNGCILEVEETFSCLKGTSGARVFLKGQAPKNLEPEADVSFMFPRI